jgi:aminopeptidase YwaD
MQAVIAMLAITTLIAAACGGDPKAPDDSASSPARQVDTPDVVAEQPDPDATEPAVDKPPTATDEGASEPAQPSADLDPVEPVESPPVVEAGDDPVRTEPLPYDNDLAIEVLRTLAVEIGPRVQGTSGEAAAADFLAESFTSFGYRVERQPFQVPSFGVESLEVRVNGTLIPASAFRFSAGGSVSGPLVPVPGFGAPADFASVDVTDGIALVERGELFFVDKVANAAAAGATAIIIYNNETGPIDGILSGGSEIPAIEVSRAAGISILADAVAGTVDVSIVLAGGFSLTDSQNVIASSGNGQCSIYVGGHYDSVPEVTGANDNASGTALVVELARAFAGSPGVDAVCFVGFGGEEGVAFSPGIAGSAALVADLVDKGVVGDVAAMMNLDVAAAGNVLVLIGTPSLVALATAIAAEADVFARPGSLPPGSGSDHVNFSNAGIPVIFPTVTGAAIHVPADNFDAIDPVLFNGIGQVAHGVLRCLIARAGESVAAPAGCPLSAG